MQRARDASELEAEVAYQLPPDLGLVFSAAEAEVRGALVDFVRDALTSP